VVGKPVLQLTSVPAQSNLLSMRTHPPAAAAATSSSVRPALNAVGTQPFVGLGFDLPSAVPSAAKVSLRDFDQRCQVKLLALQQSDGPDSLQYPGCTSISVDQISSTNAACVLFVPPDGAPDAVVDLNGIVQPTLGWLNVRAALLSLKVPANLCSVAWVRTQYRWVVWKLACYDRRFGAALPEPACTFKRVVQQCAARYEREFNEVKTPALKKILEGDEAAGKFLILAIAQIAHKVPAGAASADDDAAMDNAVPTRPGGCDVELTDGCYSVWCKLDAGLHAALQQGKLQVGMKLRVWGAALEGPTPTTPLENSNVFMKMSANLSLTAYGCCCSEIPLLFISVLSVFCVLSV